MGICIFIAKDLVHSFEQLYRISLHKYNITFHLKWMRREGILKEITCLVADDQWEDVVVSANLPLATLHSFNSPREGTLRSSSK